ncbi:hypothetical protein TcCL_NonESM12764 [Trypanosoma cruzi]|nr:hypothetical protein TcCL_NonESM12764 [Trypanosoma cruzi]
MAVASSQEAFVVPRTPLRHSDGIVAGSAVKSRKNTRNFTPKKSAQKSPHRPANPRSKVQIAPRNRRGGLPSSPAKDARLRCEESPASPRWARHMGGERCGSRDPGAADVGAENDAGGATRNPLPHTRTADQRGELRGLFDGGGGGGALYPTAARRDAAANVANGSNPAGYDDSGVTKKRGPIGDEAGAPLYKGRDGSIYPRPDRLEGTRCFPTCADNGESLVRDCGLDFQNFTLRPGGAITLDFPWRQRRRRRITTAPRVSQGHEG